MFVFVKTLILFVASLCIISAMELAWQRESPASLRDRLRFIGFGVVYIAASIAFALVFSPHVSALPISGFAGLILFLFLGDLLYYWMHRAQHAIPLLWRFHAVHHSVEKMGAGAGYHHLTEIPLKALLVGLPLSFVIRDPSGPLLAFIFGLQGPYLHSTTRLNFGRLAWLMADNRTHRIHHSLEPRHFDRNFGAFTMLWDKLFGTAHFPAANEWPEVGLADKPEPKSLRDYILVARHERQGRDGVTRVGVI